MIIPTIIFIIITLFVWSNTVVYTYRCSYGSWEIDKSTERKLPFTIWRFICILLLLIPYFNVILFLIYTLWYVKRMSFPDLKRNCIIYRIKLK